MRRIVSRINVSERQRAISVIEKPDKKVNEAKSIVTFKSLINERMFTFLYGMSKCNTIREILELCFKEVSQFVMYDYLNFIILEDFIKQQAMQGMYCKKKTDMFKDNTLIISAVPDSYGEPYFQSINELKTLSLKYII